MVNDRYTYTEQGKLEEAREMTRRIKALQAERKAIFQILESRGALV
jgi:hypothetical protein